MQHTRDVPGRGGHSSSSSGAGCPACTDGSGTTTRRSGCVEVRFSRYPAPAVCTGVPIGNAGVLTCPRSEQLREDCSRLRIEIQTTGVRPPLILKVEHVAKVGLVRSHPRVGRFDPVGVVFGQPPAGVVGGLTKAKLWNTKWFPVSNGEG